MPSAAVAGNPAAPISPLDNIQDPGAAATPWGGCGPTDSNCYVDLGGPASFTSVTVAGPSALTGATNINTSGAALTTIGNASSTTTIAGPLNVTGLTAFAVLPTLPLTAGSLIVGNGSGSAIPLLAGTNGHVLSIVGGAPVWSAIPTAPVASVFGRAGAIVAAIGDYSSDQVSEGAANLYLTNPRVLAASLTGFTAGAGTVTSADGVLSAIQKLQGTNDAQAVSITGLLAMSHAPLSIGTANGLTLSTQQLSLGLASGAASGALSASDWTSFNTRVAPTRALTAGTGLTGGGDLSLDRTFAISDTSVTAGAYGGLASIPTITVDQQGRLVAAGSVATSGIAVAGDVAGTLGATILASNSVTSATITDGTIMSADLSGIAGITNAQLANATIGLTTGVTGTDVNVSGSPASLGGSLALNIPDASATARGVVTTGLQTIAGAKTFSSATTFSSGLSTNALSVAALSGFLKATAGSVAAALVDLSADVTGVLPVAHGGTGTATLTGLAKGNGAAAFTVAIPGTDFQTPITAGSGLSFAGSTLNSVWTVASADISNNTSGNVGIGTPSPSYKLHVDGNIGTTSGGFIDGTLSTGGSAACWASSTLTLCSSDRRIKDNITDLPADALPIVARLRPVLFDYKVGHGEKNRAGFIAQEVEALIPQAVSLNDADGNLGWDVNAVVAYTVKAVQELKTANDTLRTEIEACKATHAATRQPAPPPAAEFDDVVFNSRLTPMTVDLTAPVVTVTGMAHQWVQVGTAWVDLGAAASDDTGAVGEIMASLDGGDAVVAGQIVIDTASAGKHTITYSARDAVGNIGTALRIIHIAPALGPGEDATMSP